MKQNRVIAAFAALLLLVSGCGLADGGGEPERDESLPQIIQEEAVGEEPEEEAEGYTHYTQLFEGDRVLDIRVTIAEEDWQSILEAPLDKDYKSVTVEFDGIMLENVGFSTKGNSTLKAVAGSSESDRYSFRLKFDKFEDGQTLLGLDKFSMNNNLSDASFLREYLHYEALALTDIPVPCTTFVNLYINGELYGFYTGVENEEKSFLERCFGEDYKQGVYYEAQERATLRYEEDGEYKNYTFERGTEDDKESLKTFIRILGEMPTGEKGEIESVLDVDSALVYIAANSVLGNYDSYNGRLTHNYKLYGDADGKFTVIPWDFNMSFGGFRMGESSAVSASIHEPVSGVELSQVPLIGNLLAVEEYKERYLSYIRLFTDYLEGVEERANELADLIRPHVQADPTKFYTMEEFEANLVYTEGGGESEGFGGPGGEFGGERPEGFAFPEGTAPVDEGFPGEPGEGGPPDFGDFPEGERPGPPEDRRDGGQGPAGERPDGGERRGFGGGGPGGMGGGLMNAAGSLVTFATDRAENIRGQLEAQ